MDEKLAIALILSTLVSFSTLLYCITGFSKLENKLRQVLYNQEVFFKRLDIVHDAVVGCKNEILAKLEPPAHLAVTPPEPQVINKTGLVYGWDKENGITATQTKSFDDLFKLEPLSSCETRTVDERVWPAPPPDNDTFSGKFQPGDVAWWNTSWGYKHLIMITSPAFAWEDGGWKQGEIVYECVGLSQQSTNIRIGYIDHNATEVPIVILEEELTPYNP